MINMSGTEICILVESSRTRADLLATTQ